ncbi:MAG: DUF4386 family protein [Bacteroidota bacterium]
MSLLKQNQLSTDENVEKQWRSLYKLGGAAAIVGLMGNLLDIAIGMLLGGDISKTITAIDRFAQFQGSALVGLYNFDLLNVCISIIMIPAFLALCAAHRRVNPAYAALAMLIFSIGTAIFITNNTALPMLTLSDKYAAAATEGQKNLLAAAGEAMLARGAHGSPGAFLGFVFSIIANLVMALVMLKGKIFGKATAYMGILGTALLFVYTIIVTFVPGIEKVVIVLAMPGGLLAMAWIVMYTIRLFQLGRMENS